MTDRYTGPDPESMSRLKTLLQCPELYRLSYVERWRPKSAGGFALWFGNLVHKWLESYYGGGEEEHQGPGDASPKAELAKMVLDAEAAVSNQGEAERLREMLAMLEGVQSTYPAWAMERDASLKVLAVEQDMAFLGVRYRVDLLVERTCAADPAQSGVWVVDHKTHSLGGGTRYGEMVHYDLQAQIYVAACQAKGMCYNLIGKPKIRQKQGEGKAEFVRRLTAEYANPEKQYYQRLWFPMPGLTYHKVQREIDQRRRLYETLVGEGAVGAWPRNTNACYSFGRACQFMPLCAGMCSPEDLFERKPTDDSNDAGAEEG